MIVIYELVLLPMNLSGNPSPLVELQIFVLGVVDQEKRSSAVVVIGKPDHSRVFCQVDVDDDPAKLGHTEHRHTKQNKENGGYCKFLTVRNKSLLDTCAV